MNKRIYLLMASLVTIAVLWIGWLPPFIRAQTSPLDPLPSWNSGTVKDAIVEFVTRITTESSADFLPIDDRIATFDNDGTLWAEKPVVQGLFVLDRLKQMATADPSLRQKQPFQAALDGDIAYFNQAGEEAVMQLLAATHSNITQEQFEVEARSFFDTATYPPLAVPVTEVAYQPMRELLDYLRANGFQTWICSGGGIDFMRTVSQQIYGIPPQQVIGSNAQKEFIEKDGKSVIWRLPQIGRINDKAGKPIGIDLHISKRPVFAAGNERSGGDIAMLTYAETRPGASLQLLVNHDDGDREFAYQEPDNASLNAAEANGWQVVSIKNDWKRVFAFQDSP